MLSLELQVAWDELARQPSYADCQCVDIGAYIGIDAGVDSS